MTRLSLSLLGPFRATLDDQPVTGFESDKVRALLAYLGLESDRPHHRETLAGLLWPERPERSARQNLNQALFNLRRAIGDHDAEPPFLTITRQTLQFNRASDHRLDAMALTALLDACEKHRHRRLEICDLCMDRLQQAVALYRGSFLEGFSLSDSPVFEEWSLLQRERFHRLVVDALRQLADCRERRGEYKQTLRYARRRLELDPWREDTHRQLMRVLTLGGQRNAALAQYEACRHILTQELGVEPEEETTALYERIRDGAQLHSLSRALTRNLPAPLIPFIGRETELVEIGVRLQNSACRLLTLIGPGGIGKTRLALEAAADRARNFRHGAWFVSLASLQSVEAIVPTVAEALGFSFSEGGKPQQQLVDYVRHKTMLLILDSFEHLLDGVRVIVDILRTAPGVKILVTSRIRLNVRGEHLLPIAGMDYPAEPHPNAQDATQYSAVRLFLSSARRVRPGFEPTTDDLTHIVRICRLVQGMPLGILLAAAWAEMLTPGEIVAGIDRSINFLETDWRDVPERQQSIHAVFDHSWHLLTQRDQQVFQGLSVFRGGFTDRAAQQVVGASLRDLMALVNKSLLHRMPAGRYEVHELLRQYAAEKLGRPRGNGEGVHSRHCAYYAAALRQWELDLKGPRQQVALAEIEADSENARTAWNWVVARGQVERIEQAMDGLCRFYQWRGRYQEGESACRLVADRLRATAPEDERRVLAKILTWQSLFNQRLGHSELAGQLLRQSLGLLTDARLDNQDTRAERAFVLRQMGEMAYGSDREDARKLHRRSLALYQALGDRWGTANALGHLGEIARSVGDHGEAKRLLRESLAIRQALGDRNGIADSLMDLGQTVMDLGQLEEAEGLLREGLAIRQEIGMRAGTAAGLSILGLVLLFLGKFTQAHPLLKESLAICSDLGYHYGVAFSSMWPGIAEGFRGCYEQARTLGQTGLALFQETDNRWGIGHAQMLLGWVTMATAECLQDAVAHSLPEVGETREAYAKAQRLLQESAAIFEEIGQRHELSWVLALLGVAARGLGELSRAQHYLYEALRTATETGTLLSLMLVLPAMALLLSGRGKKEQAVELYALASRYPFVANSRWFDDIVGRHIAAVAATLPLDLVAAAEERGQARDLEATAAELLVELSG